MQNQEEKSLLHIFGLARIHFGRLSCQMFCQACWGWLLAFTSARSTYHLSPRTDSFIVKRLFSQIGFVCALSICLYKSFCEACTFDSYHSSMQVLVFSAISPRVPVPIFLQTVENLSLASLCWTTILGSKCDLLLSFVLCPFAFPTSHKKNMEIILKQI